MRKIFKNKQLLVVLLITGIIFLLVCVLSSSVTWDLIGGFKKSDSDILNNYLNENSSNLVKNAKCVKKEAFQDFVYYCTFDIPKDNLEKITVGFSEYECDSYEFDISNYPDADLERTSFNCYRDLKGNSERYLHVDENNKVYFSYVKL